MTSIRQALLCGRSEQFLSPLVGMLFRAGFLVDVISTCNRLKKHNHIAHFTYAKNSEEMLALLRQKAKSSYDIIVPAGDDMLRDILLSSLPEEEKLALLPVVGVEYFSHITSKIGLSLILEKNNIKTPKFTIATQYSELESCSKRIGFPLLIKIDYSCGGAGTYECQSIADFNLLPELHYPVMVQEKIEGKSIATDALYLNKQLIFLDISEQILCRPNKFGPSVVREYRRLTNDDIALYENFKKIGEVLGAHGYINFGLIESNKGEIYLFEADMRSTVWIEYGRYFHEDPAEKIKRYFEKKEVLTIDNFQMNGHSNVILPYTPRLYLSEILINKYNCRDFHENYYKDSYLFREMLGRSLLFAIKYLRVFKKYFPLFVQNFVQTKLLAWL